MALTDLFAPVPSRHSVTTGRKLRLVRLIDLWRSRQALSRLDSDSLKDIGVSYKDAQNEAARAVWDAPAAWRE